MTYLGFKCLPLETHAGLEKHAGRTSLENKSCFWLGCIVIGPLTESLLAMVSTVLASWWDGGGQRQGTAPCPPSGSLWSSWGDRTHTLGILGGCVQAAARNLKENSCLSRRWPSVTTRSLLTLTFSGFKWNSVKCQNVCCRQWVMWAGRKRSLPFL